MALRPVFYLNTDIGTPKDKTERLIRTEMIEFEWHKGFAISQKQKSIKSLHLAIEKTLHLSNILEISTKSQTSLGVKLSAFNLELIPKSKSKSYSIENIFQSSKVFKDGGPYTDILELSSIHAKQDKRLKESGALLYFEFENFKWELSSKTAFYDWLYINALHQHKEKSKLISYSAFTDIEFNPKKSLNCQAHSAALYVSLYNNNILETYISSQEKFLELYKYTKNKQLSLFY